MKRILLSLSMIVFVGAVVIGATGAFFSDTETSTGNTFTAGAIDLTIDNESYVTNDAGVLVASPNTSWSLGDLSDLGTNGGSGLARLFFNFEDLKPGDVGEDTISIHVNNNDAWLCMATRITGTPENNQTEPEAIVDTSSGVDSGELQGALNFVFWPDDGDNVLEVNEYAGGLGVFTGTAESFMNTSPRIVADSTFNIFAGGPTTTPTPLTGGIDYHIAKAWCFGTLGFAPVSVGENPTVATGITCNGASLDNSTQTDGVKGDIEFYAVQSRNNSTFTCEANYTPSWGGDGSPGNN